MAFLRKREIHGGIYYYIVHNRRMKRDGKTKQITLQYLGRDPDPKRLKWALRYWRVGQKSNAGNR